MRTFLFVLTVAPLTACLGLNDDNDDWADDWGGDATDTAGGDTTSPEVYDDPWGAPTPSRDAVSACDPGSTWHDMLALYQATDDSVHELIACGGAQVGFARGFVGRVLLSQPEAFDMDEDTKKTLDGFLGSASSFVRDATGGWMMASSNNGRDVTFTVTFRDGDAPIVVDPLRLDSYFADPFVQVEHSFEEMEADWNLVNTYTFTYSGPGPLAHLLNGGEALPESFQIQLSLWDFIYLYFGISREGVDHDFGPLESLGEVVMDSAGTLDEKRDGIAIGYDFAGGRATVSDLGSSRTVAFELVGLGAARGPLVLDTDATDLRYAGDVRGLAGALRYTIRGGAGGDVVVDADFGEGALYPVSTWSCPAP